MRDAEESKTSHMKRRFILGGLAAGAASLATAVYWRGGKTSPVAVSATPKAVPTIPGHAADGEIAQAELPPSHPEAYTRDWFAPHLKSNFGLQEDGRAIATIQLVEVGDSKTIGDGKKSFSIFSILFTGPFLVDFESKLCHLDHPVLGGMDVLLTPVGGRKDRTDLEAVFSRRI